MTKKALCKYYLMQGQAETKGISDIMVRDDSVMKKNVHFCRG